MVMDVLNMVYQAFPPGCYPTWIPIWSGSCSPILVYFCHREPGWGLQLPVNLQLPGLTGPHPPSVSPGPGFGPGRSPEEGVRPSSPGDIEQTTTIYKETTHHHPFMIGEDSERRGESPPSHQVNPSTTMKEPKGRRVKLPSWSSVCDVGSSRTRTRTRASQINCLNSQVEDEERQNKGLNQLKPGRLSVSQQSVLSIYATKLDLRSYIPWQSSLCACKKCLRDNDPVFRAVLDASPVPFLSRNYTITKDAFNWWKGIQLERRSIGYFNTVLDKLFDIIPPPAVVEASPERCRSCAVVGNSGNLKGSHYGHLIDVHDIVIRMNRGRTKGYEEDVGTKTTHHVMYPESAINLDNTTHLVQFLFKIKDLEWLLKALQPEGNEKMNSKIANKDLVMVLNPAFMKYTHEQWLHNKGRYPSTGFMALILSLQICDEVSVFGFGADENGSWNHYYEQLPNKDFKTGPHPGNVEQEMIMQLAQYKQIQHFKGH
ncbi:CMP-N-acetylneuraminate-beta-galactosamide-alpha-2,3-sialyltransferase 1-like [Tautogolabrus adspersus]